MFCYLLYLLFRWNLLQCYYVGDSSILFFTFICFVGRGIVSRCGYQKTTGRSQFSLSTIWTLGLGPCCGLVEVAVFLLEEVCR